MRERDEPAAEASRGSSRSSSGVTFRAKARLCVTVLMAVPTQHGLSCLTAQAAAGTLQQIRPNRRCASRQLTFKR